MTVSIFCDGSAHDRSGRPGGWAFALVKDDRLLFADSGADRSTTNNVMELEAALRGLRAAARVSGEGLELVSDSRFTIDIANGSYLPIKHAALAAELRAACVAVGARTRWVKAHSGLAWNEYVDALAHDAKQTLVPERVKRKQRQRACAPSLYPADVDRDRRRGA